MTSKHKLTPLLDHWSPPEGAGEPVALLATTFVLEPDFFERDCLARFLSLQTVDEESGSANDTLARVELEERLAEPSITVLADRSTSAERTSLRWNLLHCLQPGGLLHAKVAVLMWKNATRVILGSANLTSAGYRRQIELALAADLGPNCLFPQEVLTDLATELETLLGLVPGLGAAVPANVQARHALAEFRKRVADSGGGSSKVLVRLAPTSAKRAPLDEWERVWRGSRPARAVQLSPFWDSEDPTVVRAVGALLTGRGSVRRHRIATVISPYGSIPVTSTLREVVPDVVELGPIDDESSRLLHAKCLLLESDTWVAALVGSSNHTRAGLGIGPRRHRELNVWLGASAASAEGKALVALVPQGKAVPADVSSQDVLDDEDETEPPQLPLGFLLCRLHRQEGNWILTMDLDPSKLSGSWSVAVGGVEVLDDREWVSLGSPRQVSRPMQSDHLPCFLTVEWSEGSASWTVLADDRQDLPPGPGVGAFKAHQLFAALGSGKSLADAMRDMTARRKAGDGPELDPLKRHDSPTTLLRRGRALAAALGQLRRRLERPVISPEALAARLASPLGPEFLARKVVEAVDEQEQERAEGLFTLAELSLEVGRVDWTTALSHVVDPEMARQLVSQALADVERHIAALGSHPESMANYAARCIEEARRCLSN
jgi:hypothetical protein